MSSLGEKLSDQEVEEMIQSADMDGNGKIDYDGESKNYSHVIAVFIDMWNFVIC